DLITRKSRCPIGKGRAYYIPKGTGSSSREVFQSEIYPLKEARGFLLIKLYGPPGAYQKAWKDFERAKASLGYLP
ncbi:MAG: hypothetical protein ACE5GW_08195, partial [Planctomycetota bacterium]